MSLVESPVDAHPAAQPGQTACGSRLVLLVDDEIVGIEVRRMLLERAGYRVLTAINGAAGIALFAAEPVEAVVLDFSMPGMNGGDVARSLRSIKPHIPILMLSAYTSLPPEIASLVNLSMTKGEGAPALLKNLGSLFPAAASDSSSSRRGGSCP